MTLKEMFKDYNGILFFYISGSQGVASNEMSKLLSEDTNQDTIAFWFDDFIFEHSWDYMSNYFPDDYDSDDDDEEIERQALEDAYENSGCFYIGLNSFNKDLANQHEIYEYKGGNFYLITPDDVEY